MPSSASTLNTTAKLIVAAKPIPPAANSKYCKSTMRWSRKPSGPGRLLLLSMKSIVFGI